MLGDRPRHADGVALLEGIVADQLGGDLPREDDDRHRVQVRVGDAGDGVGGTRPAGDEHRADRAGGFGIPLGRVRAPLFVANEHVFEGRLDARHLVVNLDDGPTGMPEDDLDAFSLQ